MQKSTLDLKRGGWVKLRNAPGTFCAKLSFHFVLTPSFFCFLTTSTAVTYIFTHCSYMYNYYNYSRTLCIEC
jgi:hypothetical protein